MVTKMSRGQIVFWSIILFFFMGSCAVNADMIILKSGEMYHTRRAWKEDGSVMFYKNGQVVRIDEKEVDRMVLSAPPDSDKQPSSPEEKDAVPPPNARLPVNGNDSGASITDGGGVGYLGLKWGVQLSQLDDLTPVGTDPAYGGVALFTQKMAKQHFGRASVDRIVYGFWQGALYTLTVWTSNFIDYKNLKAEAFRRYGEGSQNRKDEEKFHWIDENTDRLLSYDYDSDTGYLWMRSHRLHEKVMAQYPAP